MNPRNLAYWIPTGVFGALYTFSSIIDLFHGDALPKPIIPVVFLSVALASYFLRPADRRLASPDEANQASASPLVPAVG